MVPVAVAFTLIRYSLHILHWDRDNQAISRDPDNARFLSSLVPHLPLNMSISQSYFPGPYDSMPCSPYKVFQYSKYYGAGHQKPRFLRSEQLHDLQRMRCNLQQAAGSLKRDLSCSMDVNRSEQDCVLCR